MLPILVWYLTFAILFLVSLDNVMSNVNLIKKGILLTRNEYETHQHKVLKDFLDGTQEKVVKVIDYAEECIIATCAEPLISVADAVRCEIEFGILGCVVLA